MRARSVVIIVLLVLSLTLVAQNTEVVQFRMWFWTLEMSRVLLLVGSLIVGILMGLLLGRPWKRQKKFVVQRAEAHSAKAKAPDVKKEGD